MAQAVRRDMHKMKAFVRFRQVPDEDAPGEALHVAWFEPDAPHRRGGRALVFVRRFAQHALGHPHARALACAGTASSCASAPARSRADAPPADAGEALWLTYYRSIFNPARLKLQHDAQGDAAPVLATTCPRPR